MYLPVRHYLQNGKYQVLRTLGQGAFGITYKGCLFSEPLPLKDRTAEKLGQAVVIRELFLRSCCYRTSNDYSVAVRADGDKALFENLKAALIEKAREWSELHHPHILSVSDVFEENHTVYIVTAYVAGGRSLKRMLEQTGKLTEQTMLRYICQAGSALQFIHDKGIAHLDMKPGNILINKNEIAQLVDFWVSVPGGATQALSKGFAPVEQYEREGLKEFSPCVDVYSLGATMYYLLTGILPVESILRAKRPFMRPSIINSSVTPKTERALLKAMQILPGDRFQSIAEMMEALGCPLRELGEEPVEVALSPSPVGKRKGLKRRSVVILSLTAFVVAVATLLYLFVDHWEIMPQRNQRKATPPPQAPVIIEEDDFFLLCEEDTTAAQPESIAATTEPAPRPVLPAEEKSNSQPVTPTPAPVTPAPAVEQPIEQPAEKPLNKPAASDTALPAPIDNDTPVVPASPYEEQSSFGTLTIVRKKENGKYGAIDPEGNERIPCIYFHADIVDEGCAFERGEGTFDIYNDQGTLLRSDKIY